MLSGNPNTFAIWCDPVDAWSTEKFQNGCFGYFIGGELIWSMRSTLGVDLSMLAKLHCMRSDVEDVRLFNLPSKDAYCELCRRAFPATDSDAETSDFTHLVSAESLSDDSRYVFLIECGDKAKLIYGTGYDATTMGDITIPRGEFQSVVKIAEQRFSELKRRK
ncbi:immunity 42 family protein [Paraburkholderia ferrariae]|uniref:immunity 42 family protein n=1 Tax=Paraburkholderia ferrariae TaxID=386056 RepID=UPI000A068656|nr:immunity 42 family protein [Paraburkholderia ferrariae]